MTSTRLEPSRSAPLFGVLVGAALLELILLRTITRTLIHIPGLARFETPIRVIAEVGRFAYYLAVVFLIATLAVEGYRSLRAWAPPRMVAGGGAILFLGTAAAGRVGLISATTFGVASLAVIIVCAAASRRGRSVVPVACFVSALAASGLATLGQGGGAALTGRQVDGVLLIAEIAMVLAAVTSPLLLARPPSRGAVLVGLGVAVVAAAAFASASPTLSILVLWNLGAPGWLPGILYAVAAGSLATTTWSAITSGEGSTAAGLLLLVAGGIGVISTYQTGLVLAGLLLLGSPRVVQSPRQGSLPFVRANRALAVSGE